MDSNKLKITKQEAKEVQASLESYVEYIDLIANMPCWENEPDNIMLSGGLSMQVENKDDRMESDGECDNCCSDVPLERFYHYGPGHNVQWLCKYCCRDFTHGDPLAKTFAAMLNKFETDNNRFHSDAETAPRR